MKKAFAEILVLLSNKDLRDFFQIPYVDNWISIINPREVFGIIAECEDTGWQADFCGVVCADAYEESYARLAEVELELEDLEELFILAETAPEQIKSHLAGIDEKKKAKLLKALMYQLLLHDPIQV